MSADLIRELRDALRQLDEAFCSDDYGTRDGRNKGRKALVAARAAIAAADARLAQPVTDAAPISKEALIDLIAGMLGDTYHCTRVWHAWGVGTMSEDDFHPVDESDTPAEIADTVLALYASAAPAAQPVPAQAAEPDADGAALRRAVANDLTVRHYGGSTTAQSGRPGSPSAYETESDHANPCRAARMAIHRAAAIVEAGATPAAQPVPAQAVAQPLINAASTALAEVEKATRKFPTWPTDPLHALAVLGEEFGELTKDVLQMVYEPHKTSTDNVRKECIQTAAMALRFMASLDRYEYRPGEQHSQGNIAAAPAAPTTGEG